MSSSTRRQSCHRDTGVGI
jgi:hypothetical protein